MEKKYRSVLEMAKELSDSAEFSETLERKLKNRTVSKIIFSIRNKKGLTQLQLAEKMGLSQSAISKLESSSDENITVGQIKAFTKALGISTHLVIFEKKMESVDRVKYHWFEIKKELDALQALCKGDREIEKGVQNFNQEAFMNIASGLMQYLDRSKLAKIKSGDKNLQISRIGFGDLLTSKRVTD